MGKCRTCGRSFNWDMGQGYAKMPDGTYLCSVNCELKEYQQKVNRLEADAARWNYVRLALAQAMSPHMDGTFTWRLHHLGDTRAPNIDEAIDKLMKDQPLCPVTGVTQCTP